MCSEAIHCVDRATVCFAIYPDGFDGPRILAEITEDALRDLFGAPGDRDSLLQAYSANATAIDTRALECYRLVLYRPVVLTAAEFLAAAARAGEVRVQSNADSSAVFSAGFPRHAPVDPRMTSRASHAACY